MSRSPYRLISGRHGRFEDLPGGKKNVVYGPGDIIGLTPAEAKNLAGRVVPHTETSAADAKEWESVVSGSNARELVGIIKELDDADDIAALRQAEEARSRPRSSVLKAADTRLAQLAE